MSDSSAVLFVFFILFASGLNVPIKKFKVSRSNDLSFSTVSDSNPINVTASEVSVPTEKEKPRDKASNAQKTDSIRDRFLNKVKERSLVKIIKKAKRPQYKPQASILENDMFTVVAQDGISNNSVQFHEVYNPVAQPNENYIVVKPPPKLFVNTTGTPASKLQTLTNHGIVNTYLPIKSLTNGSAIEIIKNTILRSESLLNNPSNNEEDKTEQLSPRKSTKHAVRKYFRLHSSIAKELEHNSLFNKNTRSALDDLDLSWNTISAVTKAKAISGPTLKIEDKPYGQTPAHHMQSIVLRWNLILV